MNIDEEIKQHDDKRKVLQEDAAKRLYAGQTSGGEEIVAYLHSDPKALRALRTLGIAGVIISVMSYVIGLALYFRPLMFSWGNKGIMFVFWFVVGFVAMALGIIFLCSQYLIFKKGGILLTNKKIIFNGGRFAEKSTVVNLEELNEDGLEVFHSKGGGYTVKIAGKKSFYNETPFDFKTKTCEEIGKNRQKK